MNNLVSRPAHHDDNYDVARKVIEVFFGGWGDYIKSPSQRSTAFWRNKALMELIQPKMGKYLGYKSCSREVEICVNRLLSILLILL